MSRLWFEKLSRFDRPAEPCTVAAPFAQGQLPAGAPVCVTDAGKCLPTQQHVTAVWPDGSTKWLLVHFLADLPGNAGKAFELVPSQASAAPDQPARLEQAGDVQAICTGPLRIELAPTGPATLLGKVSGEGFDLLGGQVKLFVGDGDGAQWHVLPTGGWEVLQSGPVRVVVQAKGRHVGPDGGGWLDFALRLAAFAGKPWLVMEYQVLNRERADSQQIHEMTLELSGLAAAGQAARRAVATSNYRSQIRTGSPGQPLRYVINAEHLLYEANEQAAEVHYGTFWADWCDQAAGGACVSVHQAYQNFPKALSVDDASLRCELLPPDAGPLTLARGMAKTHRMMLHLHGPDASLEDLNVRTLQFQMPDRPVLQADTYRRAGVFEDVWVDRKHPPTERRLIDIADHHARCYGMLHWGDTPDMGYTAQGRGRGEIVWTNNEYDYPHAQMLMYARTGERRMLDYMLVAARHWMDVDVCHDSDDPLRHQAQITHSAGHVSGHVAVSHEWVQGLLDYYHQTGDRFAHDTALGIGQNILRHLERPNLRQPGAASARETGWALRSLVALHQETHDRKWLEPADLIVAQFQDWMDQCGAWLAPYTDHTLIRVPFMIAIAMVSLGCYYRARPRKDVAAMIIAAADDVLTHCTMSDGRMYYKELPSLQARGAGIIMLEAMAVAYEASGQRRYLEAGMGLFTGTSGAGDLGGRGDRGGKRVVGDAVISPGASSKGLAATFGAIMSFYRCASREGLLD